MSISIRVQCSQGGETFDAAAEPSMTIAELKVALEPRAGVPPDRQRLIFRGRILSNEATLAACGIENGNTVFLVKSSAARTGEAPARTNPASTAALPTATPPPSPFTGFGGAMPGMPGMPGMPAGLGNPEMMRTMLQNPHIQRMLENPDLIRTMMQANPQVQAMLRANPQLEHVLTDPETMRQAMRMVLDPNGAQDMLRSHDRAMANIEMMPGGYNALARMFQDNILPLDEAMAQGREGNAGNTASSRAPPAPQGGPMPNPWAQPPPQAPAGNAQPANNARPPLDLTGLLNAMPPGFAMGGAGGGGAAGLPPAFANILSNPELLARAMEPQNQQAIMQLHQSIATLRQAGLLPEEMFPPVMFPGTAPPLSTPTAPAPSTTQPPEVRFASQLEQLEGMGFTDRAANIRALTTTQGNVNAAVERLLGSGV